mmetsp:Transcript_109945/g.154178  ORF Transcript_109945/g.154178 Transcript_109945/m.154178 type:complete len:138 (+) Transcript_109945:23-436(+)
MSSGITPDEDCVTKFNELKLGHKYRYVVFKITDDFTKIVTLKTAEPSATFDDFLGELPDKECRYAVYDYEYEDDGRKQSKILFVVWAPDTAKVKPKMLVASSKDSFKRVLVGIGAEIQATELSEIDEEAVKEKVTRV